MRAGTLDRVIVIERATTVISINATPVVVWAPLQTLRAQLIEASADEFIRNYGASSEAAVVFRTRWLDGVTLADRVTYNGRAYDLKQIKEIGRREGLEFHAAAVGAQ